MSQTATKTRTEMPQQSNGHSPPATIPAGALQRDIEYTPLGASAPIKLSVALIRMVLQPKTKSGRPAPDHELMKFMFLCRARQIDPFEGEAYLVGYEGQDGDSWTLMTSIYVFLKRSELSPLYDGKESGVIVKTKNGTIEEHIGDFLMDDEILLGGWCRVYRKDRRFTETKRVEFKRYSSGRNRWKDDPGGMICKVAEMQALRDTFPTTLGGLYCEEEMAGLSYQPPAPAPKSLPTSRESLRQPRVKATQQLPSATIDVPVTPSASLPSQEEGEPLAEGELSPRELAQIEVTEHFQRIGSSEAVIKQMLDRYDCGEIADLTEASAKALAIELAKIPGKS